MKSTNKKRIFNRKYSKFYITLLIFSIIFSLIFFTPIIKEQKQLSPPIPQTPSFDLPGQFIPPSPYGSTDHSIVKKDDLFHIFYIKKNLDINGGDWASDPNEDSFGHSSSSDLRNWNHHSDVVQIGSLGSWDHSNVWAPHILELDSTYYMFYTGVEYPEGQSNLNIQQIGLATSTDLTNWEKHYNNPIWNCGMTSWAQWNPGQSWQAQCRDPMVFYDRSYNRFIMYFMAVKTDTQLEVIGIAISTNLIDWEDTGFIAATEGAKAESPFLTYHNNKYYLFWSALDSVEYAISDSPTGPFTKIGPDAVPGGFASEVPFIDSTHFYTEVFTSTITYIKKMHWLTEPNYEYYEINTPLPVHPRTLFNEMDIPYLKAKVRNGGEDQIAFNKIIQQADTYWINNPTYYVTASYDYGLKVIPQLGLAYWLSDDSNPNKNIYLEKCQDALIYLANNYDPDSDGSDNPNRQTRTASRINTLALGYDLCFSTATSQEKTIILNEINTYILALNWVWRHSQPGYLTERAARSGAGLAMAGMMLEGESFDDNLRQQAISLGTPVINNYLQYQFGSDGVGGEGPLYSSYTLTTAVPYIETTENYNGQKLWETFQLKGAADWLLYIITPRANGYTLKFNDAHSYSASSFSGFINWIEDKYNYPLVSYVYENLIDTYGTAPGLSSDTFSSREIVTIFDIDQSVPNPNQIMPKSKLFNDDLYIYRSGWPLAGSSEDILFSFISGKFYGGHENEDKNSFTIYAYGEDLLTDIGYVIDTTENHNLITIDNVGQQRANAGCGNDGRISKIHQNEFIDYVSGDATQAYVQGSELNWIDSFWDWCWPGNPNTPTIFQKAYRNFFVIKDQNNPYFIMIDNIQKDLINHNYRLNLQTNSNNDFIFSSNPITLNALSAKLDIFMANPDFNSLSISTSTNSFNVDGFTSIDRLQIDSNTINPNFFIVLYPYDIGILRPLYSKLTVTNGLGVSLNFGSYIDYALYKLNGPMQTSGILSDGNFIYLREEGDAQKFSMIDGTSLEKDSINIITINGIADVSSSGTTITISDNSLEYEIYGPNVNQVLYNNIPISFNKIGNYIYINQGVPLICNDGTPYNQCSVNQPLYCNNNGQLINNCQQCLCPLGYDCQPDGTCIQQSQCIDLDNDGYGNPGSSNCPNGSQTDCNDNNINIHPQAIEICDGQDNNCINGIDENPTQLCTDNIYCNGLEICNGVLGCGVGTPVDCSINNIPPVNSCFNNPDNNPYTLDTRTGFTSTCNEVTDSCTTGTGGILIHTCNLVQCTAQCDPSNACTATECDLYDGCYNNIYRDYNYVTNTCLDTCSCTSNICNIYVLEQDPDNDGYSLSCNDCNPNNANINPGADEICNDNIDNDCDNSIDLDDPDCINFCSDNDGDNYGIGNSCLGPDCDDSNPSLHTLISCNYNGNSCGNYQLCLLTCPVPPNEICGNNIDDNCNGPIDEGCTQQLIINLQQGYNFISIPFELSNNNIESVFAGILSDLNRIYSYETNWNVFRTNPNPPSTLTSVESLNGYIVILNNPASITISGTIDNNKQRNLNQGWNLISINSINQIPITSALQGLDYLSVWRFDANIQDYVQLNIATDSLEPGKSYWIYLNSPGIFNP